MSAYVVDRNHIAYLIEAATSRRITPSGPLSWVWNRNREKGTYDRASLGCLEPKQEARIGQMLWDENVKSVRFRYNTPEGGDLPGPNDCDYKYGKHGAEAWLDIDPRQVLMSIMCLDYQCCEHRTWEDSEAFAFCAALERAAIHAIPGMDDMKWGAPKPANGVIRLLGLKRVGEARR